MNWNKFINCFFVTSGKKKQKKQQLYIHCSKKLEPKTYHIKSHLKSGLMIKIIK